MTIKPILFPAAFPVMLCAIAPAFAQNAPVTDVPSADAKVPPAPLNDKEVTFSARQLEYDNDADIVTAIGDVRMLRDGNRLRADRVVWNRKTGNVRAEGNVTIVNPGGDTAYGDTIDLTDSLRDGVVENLLIVLEDGGRAAAIKGTRNGDIVTLERASYSPCAVTDSANCPKNPSWKITAIRVVYDAKAQRLRYYGARIDLFGLPLIPLPGLSHPTGNGNASGLLTPDIRIDRVNGFELSLPYYIRIDSDRDLTITPHIYSKVPPMLEGQFRALTDLGAFQVSGYVTHSRRQNATISSTVNSEREPRGYLDASGRLQFSPEWSLSGSLRLASDRTFLRRYDISRDDRLRSTINLERIGTDSYFSFSGWAVQTLRTGAVQGQQPIALPIIDYRRRFTNAILGGTIQVQGNSMFLTRTTGQDTQRAFGSVRWDLRKITPLGQELTLTAYARGDVYHTDETARTTTIAYRGKNGWSSQTIASVSADLRWPFVGTIFGKGTQRFTPRLQIITSPVNGNLRVPNEDSRAVDLEDSNLFALNRFGGYDRYEDGTRITYGLEWAMELPGFTINTLIGQSYRFSTRPTLFPDGTGLTSRTSDIVGRTEIKFKRYVSIVHRYRIDKDNLTVRRNEVDAVFGTNSTYVKVGYLRLNRDIDPALEDLRDREEIRLGGRVQFAKYWSIFGSTTIDLTDRKEDPASFTDGYEPVRHRLGIVYEDECLELGVTWRRDYKNIGDARRGSSYLFRVAFKQLGR